MKPPERGALLAISASAARTFFDQDTIKGLQIRTAGEVVSLKGTKTTSGADVVPVEQRGRGGLSALVSVAGTNSPEFFRLLRRSGFRSSAPFFLLTELQREWVGIKHWKKSNAPLNQPYLRVWMGESPTGRGRKAARPVVRAVASLDEEGIDWRLVRRTLTQAKRMMTRRGRVPRDMEIDHEQARRDLDQFERLIAAVFPERGNPEALQARLERATELRQVAEQQRDSANDERDAVMEELAALQKVLDRERRERRTGTTEELSRPRPGRRGRRQFNVQIEPEDHLATGEPEEHTSQEPPTEESGDAEMQTVTETARLADELAELEGGTNEGDAADVVVEGGGDPESGTADEHVIEEAHVTEEETNTEQPPTEGIQFPDEEDDHHHE